MSQSGGFGWPSGFEVTFCGFLDRCADVAAFAKLPREVRFSLEYRAEGGRLAYYYPDFAVRLSTGDCLVIETKGRADLDVPHKDRQAHRWSADATLTSGVRRRYLRVDQEVFDDHASRLTSMAQLVDLAFAVRRQQYLASQTPPRKRSQEEIPALMDRVSEQMRGVTGIDEEIRRMRDEPRA